MGTAGHVDHGKTTLIRALTGIDTDRLKEEKQREMTIELGFAYLDLPSGRRIGIVDVPGHERFVRHMVAGAQGMDLVAMIVAADEGVMPQTREHLQICQLLGVKKGLVVITKIDLVEREFIELVREEVSDFLKGTFLEGAPIVEVSSVTGEGLEELVELIDRLVDEVQERPSDGLFRLPIDRVFTIKGFGTVVTGTLISGEVSIGDEIQVLPQGIRGKVRGLQVHKEKVQKALAGQRTAINLLGIDREAIQRGDVLVHSGTLEATSCLDVHIQHLPDAPVPLRNGMTLQLHIGTSHVPAKVILLGRDALEPGERGFAQLRLERPVVVVPFDRFVLRGSGIIQTWGGGIVLDAHPGRHKRFRPEVIQGLSQILEADPETVLLYHLWKHSPKGMDEIKLMAHTGLRRRILEEAVRALQQKGKAVLLEGSLFLREDLERVKGGLIEALSDFHRQNPLRPGASPEELRGKVGADERLFEKAVQELLEGGEIEPEGELLRLKGHRVPVEEDELGEIEEILLRAGLKPPTLREIAQLKGIEVSRVKEIMALLARRGIIVRVKEELYFHSRVLEDLKERLVNYLREKGRISIQDFKALTGVSRKFAVPLAEYFDQIRVTIRVGDDRILRGS